MLLLFACIGNVSAKGIKEGDTIKSFNGADIYILNELSGKMKIIGQAQLLKMECSTGDAFRIGAGVEGDFFLPKFASFHAEFNSCYFNMQKTQAKDLNKSGNSLGGFSLLEFGGRFHLIDIKARARHKLILSSSSTYSMGYTVTTEHYIKAKLPCRKILAARGGIYRTSAPVSTDMNQQELAVSNVGAVKTKDGTVLSDVYFTNDHTTGFYVGLSEIVNMSVRTKNNVSGYSGYRYFTSFFREVYLDALIAGTTFDPIIAGGVSHEIEPNTSGSFQTSNIGWRLGKKWVFTRKTINMGFCFEIGNRPGVQGRGAYFGTGFNLAFVK